MNLKTKDRFLEQTESFLQEMQVKPSLEAQRKIVSLTKYIECWL